MKRKSYAEKVLDLAKSAKAETIALMKEKGIREIEIPALTVMVVADDENEQADFYNVTRVFIDNDNREGVDMLYFDSEAPGFWYYNPVVWLDIHEAVFRLLNEFHKRFRPIA